VSEDDRAATHGDRGRVGYKQDLPVPDAVVVAQELSGRLARKHNRLYRVGNMAKTRTGVPETVREKVLEEFNHRCAICGADRPQVHHIDEDPANNEPLNLIPLCPNCHLTDHHNPTKTTEPAKLKLFRQYKDPIILKPQFHALFLRIQFLNSIGEHSDVNELHASARELIEFVQGLEMGAFYAGQLSQLLSRPPYGRARVMGDPDSEQRYREGRRKHDMEYKEQLVKNQNRVQELAIELLRFQKWD
jgi:hypothetical protein